MRVKCLKVIFPAAAAAMLMLNAAGCATISYHDHFKYANSERNEFAGFNGKYKLYRGILLPEVVERNGIEYHELQFRDVLAGSGRYLNILVPVREGSDPVIYETPSEIKAGKTAYLFVERMCCTDDYKEILDPLHSRDVEKDPELMKRIIREQFPESEGSASPVIFCSLVFSNVFHYDLMYQVWRPYPGGTPLYESGFYLQKPYSTIDVNWDERSIAGAVAVKAGYIFPVALDIVTSPVQLVAVLVYVAAGGAAR